MAMITEASPVRKISKRYDYDHLWYLLPDDLSDSECIVRELYHSVRRASECALRIEGSFLFAWMFGLENNIYLQTGLIMLIGLLAKTAILLTEYAAERRKAGMGLIASAVSAAKARLRPIR